MASAPMARKLKADIATAGGVEVAVFDRLRNGESLANIAATFDVGRALLWRYMKKEPARYDRYRQAWKDGAAGMVDKGQDLLEKAADHAKNAGNSAHVQAVRNQTDYLKWQAGVIDRKTFGSPDKAAEVTISIQQLHLEALQAKGGPPLLPEPAPHTESPTQRNLEASEPIALPLPSNDE